MAAIDKIYGTYEDYWDLYTWLNNNKPKYLKYLYNSPEYDNKFHAISNFPSKADRWLYFNCPLKFVKEAIEEQYNLLDYKKE